MGGFDLVEHALKQGLVVGGDIAWHVHLPRVAPFTATDAVAHAALPHFKGHEFGNACGKAQRESQQPVECSHSTGAYGL